MNVEENRLEMWRQVEVASFPTVTPTGAINELTEPLEVRIEQVFVSPGRHL